MVLHSNLVALSIGRLVSVVNIDNDLDPLPVNIVIAMLQISLHQMPFGEENVRPSSKTGNLQDRFGCHVIVSVPGSRSCSDLYNHKRLYYSVKDNIHIFGYNNCPTSSIMA